RHARKRVDRSPMLRPARWTLEAAVMAGLWGLSASLSPERASAAGRRLLQRLGPSLKNTTHLRRNLGLAFPDRSAPELDRLVRQVWGQMGAVLAEYPHLGAICAGEGGHRVRTVIRFDLERLRRQNRPAIFVTAHLANWEIAAAVGARADLPLTVVYTPIENPWIDRRLYRYRQALGCKMIAREDALRPLMGELAAGRSVGLLMDQRTDSGAPIPFFGIEKLTTLVPARLALRFDCDLIPVRVERLQGVRFRVTAFEPVSAGAEDRTEQERAMAMTRQVHALFESWIKEAPEAWFCSNRRWPKKAQPPRAALVQAAPAH
ncbi:MAG TPA: lysophospholipid acyltransferase family protein, partial [Burkholderiales bacterium]|nr:lysophospholipid acyltransferase family protein [Burkholderiales bacterium]